MGQTKDFLVSTADAALFFNGMLACTATANLNSSIEVSMQEQNVNGGKSNKLLYSFKYGRELNVTLEAANWDLKYLAVNLGSDVVNQLSDIYIINECVQLTSGIGTLPKTPIGNVAVVLSDNTIVEVTPTGKIIDLTSTIIDTTTVRVTYKFSGLAKTITIDSDSSPKVYKLVLDADRHNNAVGKVGHIQIEIPSYQPSGNFTMNFTPDGVTSTNLDGRALAVEGDSCANGSSVYAYVHEYDEDADVFTIDEIVATPSTIAIEGTGTSTIRVRGLKDNYMPIEIANEDCMFASDTVGVATVGATTGIVTGVSEGTTVITVSYAQGSETLTDTVNVTVN